MAVTSVLRILESVQNSFSITRTLGEIELCYDDNGSPIYHVGNCVVLFKIRYNGELRALRCYTRHSPHLAEIYQECYLPQEIFVYSGVKSGQWIDIVLERWVEGVTLKESIERAIEREDRDTLRSLANSFDTLAAELLASDTAHGDLTAENIMVTPSNKLQLIDLDCTFLPQFARRRSPELGTAAYQPPSRRPADFDKDMDDYSIALISTALRALSLDERLYHKYAFYDGLLLSPKLIAQGECEALEECYELFYTHNMATPYRVANLLRSNSLRIPMLAEIFKSMTDDCDPIAPLLLSMRGLYVGYINILDELVVPHVYDDGHEFSHKTALVKLRDKWLVINTKGQPTMVFEGYDSVRPTYDGKIETCKDGTTEICERRREAL